MKESDWNQNYLSSYILSYIIDVFQWFQSTHNFHEDLTFNTFCSLQVIKENQSDQISSLGVSDFLFPRHAD